MWGIMDDRSGIKRIDLRATVGDAPILFWDVDGVLNHPGVWGNVPRQDALDPILVARAARLCADLQARCVLSSSWRLGIGYVETIVALKRQGWTDVRQRFIGDTPYVSQAQRGIEIRQWFRDYGVPETHPYAVIDDSDDMLGVRHRFVRTNGSKGLTDDDCLRVKALFL